MSYSEAKSKYAAFGVDTEAAINKLKTVPVSLHCWQGDDVRGFDTDPNAPLTGGIQTTGNYPGRARNSEELMADIDEVLSLIPGKPKMNLHASYAIFENGEWLTAICSGPNTLRNGLISVRNGGLDATSTRHSFPTKNAIR